MAMRKWFTRDDRFAAAFCDVHFSGESTVDDGSRLPWLCKAKSQVAGNILIISSFRRIQHPSFEGNPVAAPINLRSKDDAKPVETLSVAAGGNEGIDSNCFTKVADDAEVHARGWLPVHL